MVKTVKEFMKKILIVTMLLITLTFFTIDPYVQAAQLPAEGEFYYAGTTKGTYVVTENIFAWLLANLSDIIDWILGFVTMGFRMAFVGWGTIFEWTLTSTLESTTGARYLKEALSTTKIESANDSSQNVTVESIVYNNVPIFNINFFDFEIDTTRTGTGRDLTKLVCSTCDLSYEDCTCLESNKCKPACTSCRTKEAMNKLAEGDEEYKTVVVIIKETVAEWFYIIRFICVAAMLVVLIAIGIKMALSSLASEKAVYKRMLVDWLIGMIFLFAIEYVMLFIINVNQVAVDVIEDYAGSEAAPATKILKEEFGDGEDAKTLDDLEVSVYEAVRTRAYDPKLINGLTGTVMYLSLVFFAWRFSWMYIKRYFTLIVLTLMAPAVAFSYALQKVFTGKGKAWSTWLNEYIVNVLIQTVHAIIYASFVSMALVISLDSIAGMIVAFILMNFMLKADAIFRKIFKMSSGGSLLDRVSKGADEARIDKLAKTASSAIAGAKPAMAMIAKTPGAAAVRGIAKGALTEGVLAGARIKEHFSQENVDKRRAARRESKITETLERQYGEKGYQKLVENESRHEAERARIGKEIDSKWPARRRAKKDAEKNFARNIRAMMPEEREKEAARLVQEEQAALRAAMQARAENKPNQKELFNKYNEVRNERKKFDRYANKSYLARQEIKDSVFDYNKYYDEYGKRRKSYEYDPEKGKVVKNGATSKVLGNFAQGGALHLDKDEREMLSKTLSIQTAPFKIALASFTGLGCLTSNPGLGLGLLGYSVANAAKLHRPNRNLGTPRHRSKYANRNYSNVEFPTSTMRLMNQTVLEATEEEVLQLMAPNLSYTRRKEIIDGKLLAKYGKEGFNTLLSDPAKYHKEFLGLEESLFGEEGQKMREKIDSKLDKLLIEQLGQEKFDQLVWDGEAYISEKAKRERALYWGKEDTRKAREELQDKIAKILEKEYGKEGYARLVENEEEHDKEIERIRLKIDPEEIARVEARRKVLEQKRQERIEANDLIAEQNRIDDVIDRMYQNDPGSKSFIGRLTDDFIDNAYGAVGEQLDELAELEHKKYLQHIARYDADARNLMAKNKEIELYKKFDEVDRLSAEEDKARGKNFLTSFGNQRAVTNVVLPTTVDELVKDAIKSIGILSTPISIADKRKIAAKAKELAREKGLDLKQYFEQDMNVDVEKNKSIDDYIDKNMDQEIDRRINQEIISKIDGAVDRITSDASILEQREKNNKGKKLDVEKPETYKDYELTETERYSIAQVVREQVKKDKKIDSLDSLGAKNNLDDMAKAYSLKTNGNVSVEEAKVQIKVFMNDLQAEDTYRGRVKKGLVEAGRGEKIAEYAKTSDTQRKKDIVAEIHNKAKSSDTMVSAEVVSAQSKLLEDILNQTKEVYRMNEEVKSFGKPNDERGLNDYQQYVKIDSSKAYSAVKNASKKGKKLNYSMGNDPGLYGPLIGLERIIDNM